MAGHTLWKVYIVGRELRACEFEIQSALVAAALFTTTTGTLPICTWYTSP